MFNEAKNGTKQGNKHYTYPKDDAVAKFVIADGKKLG